MTTVQSDITYIRKKLNISLRDLGTLIGVSAATISLWERGEAEPSRLHTAVIMQLRQRAERENAEQIKRGIATLLVSGGIVAFLIWLANKSNDN